MYPGRRPTGIVGREFFLTTETYTDFYACPTCDALVLAGKPLPAGVATFSVAVREDG
jgi:hypothetical protein